MATYINLGSGHGYVDAAHVVRFRIEMPSHRLQMLTSAGSTEMFHPTVTADRDGEDILQDLLPVLGTPAKQPRARVISLDNGKIEARWLD